MEYLRSNNIHVSIHNWKEEEWDLKVLGFFTHLHPGKMPIEYCTKIVSNMIKSPKKHQRIPKFRIKPIIMITSTSPTNLSVRTYAIEVKAQDSREMMSILKENIAPGIFLPVQLKFINKIAFDKALIYISQKQDTTWTVVVNHITDGSFFKLEHKIKALLETDHVIHDAIKKMAKVLVNKQQFYEDRKKLKAHLAEWNAELDPDDIRECNIAPEVAHIAQDSISEEADSFYSSSITSIMAFEVSEIYIPTGKSTKMSGLSNDTQKHNQQNTEPTFSSDDKIQTLKQQIEEYKTELQKQTQKIDQMQEMLQLVFSELTDKEDLNNNNQSSDKFRRQLYSQP
jgi:hypothetical protein